MARKVELSEWQPAAPQQPLYGKSIAWTCAWARMAPAIGLRNTLGSKGVANRGHVELAIG